MLSVFNKKTAKKPDDFLNKHLMKNCAWGQNYREFLIEIGFPEKNIFVTGRPSLSILKMKAERGDNIRKQLAKKFDLDSGKIWLFFPLTCLHAFFSDNLIRNFIRNKRLSNQVDLELAFARRNYVQRTIHTIFSWIESLKTLEQKEFQIILRPHPLISEKQHQNLFQHLFGYVPKFVFITKSFSAHEWLIASDSCYSNYSSLVLDAYFINKPAYLMEPEPFPDFLIYEWFAGFSRAFNGLLEHVPVECSRGRRQTR